jgi:hypothetical protein
MGQKIEHRTYKNIEFLSEETEWINFNKRSNEENFKVLMCVKQVLREIVERTKLRDQKEFGTYSEHQKKEKNSKNEDQSRNVGDSNCLSNNNESKQDNTGETIDNSHNLTDLGSLIEEEKPKRGRKVGSTKEKQIERLKNKGYSHEIIYIDTENVPEGAFETEYITSYKVFPERISKGKIIEFRKRRYIKITGNKVEEFKGKGQFDLFPGTIFTPQLMALILFLKYSLFVPLYRQEKKVFYLLGLSRGNILKTITNHVMPTVHKIYERLNYHIMNDGNPFLQMDESTYKILNAVKKIGYIWQKRTPEFSLYKIVLFMIGDRSEASFKKFLGDIKNMILVTDGYAVYKSKDGIRIARCLAHIRRKFVEIYKRLSLANQKNHITYRIAELFGKAIILNKKILESKPTDKEFIAKSKDVQLLLLEAMILINNEFETVDKKSDYGKALAYAINMDSGIWLCTQVNGVPATNNAVESYFKNFATFRNNVVFQITEEGAQESCEIFTIVATGGFNSIETQGYWEHIFSLDVLNMTDEQLDKILPCSKEIIELFGTK